MKKQTYLILFCCICLVACGGKRSTKPTPAPAPPASSTKPPVSPPEPSTPAPSTSAPQATPPPETPAKPGGYYLDDGPDTNPPQNLDSIPNAIPKQEPILNRSNKPYKALGATYKPMTSYQPYKAKGVASWYGKRFHGKKTSSGEVYDMYGMSAAHTILPLPSYVKVTNPANGRSVIVRVNDRGPFKHSRVIDLSYAAAYKLRFISKGSTVVEVEAIDTNNLANYAQPTVAQESAVSTAAIELPAPVATTTSASTPVPTTIPAITTTPINLPVQDNNPVINGYFIQAGAFKNETNADALIKKIQGLDIEQNVGMAKVYNGDLHRLKLGPYESKQAAEQVAASIRKQLNITTIITNQ
jgi:rare lipoprotein A